MIIARSPLRITLGGGGTDLPSYYKKRGGYLIAAAIDKYVYLAINPAFTDEAILKYMKYERVKRVDEIQHPIIRECMRQTDTLPSGIEICSMADIPAGTGLGSSGSFTTALLKGLYAYNNRIISPRFLAESAVDIEMNQLKEPVGKQDQYIAAFGGVTQFEFLPDERVEISPLAVSKEVLYELEDNLMLFFTGYSRSASDILREQDDRSKRSDSSMLQNLDYVKELGLQTKKALEQGDLTQFGRLMNEHWEYKRRRSENMSNGNIDRWYAMALQNGAIGGKLIGAGGGGFLMFLAQDRRRLREAMTGAGLQEVRFRFDFEGTKVLVQ